MDICPAIVDMVAKRAFPFSASLSDLDLDFEEEEEALDSLDDDDLDPLLLEEEEEEVFSFFAAWAYNASTAISRRHSLETCIFFYYMKSAQSNECNTSEQPLKPSHTEKLKKYINIR